MNKGKKVVLYNKDKNEGIISDYVIKEEVFSFLSDKQKLKIIMCNRQLQILLDVCIEDYKTLSGKYKIGEKNGKGKEYNFKDELIFEGEYLNGKRNGKGKEYNFKDELIFEGKYENGKRNGEGKEYYDNGNVKFEGEYKNDEREGNGKEYYDSKNVKFEGEFKNGKKWNGKGYNKHGQEEFQIKNGNAKIVKGRI